jgi:DNA polymerase-3 subunit delta'
MKWNKLIAHERVKDLLGRAYEGGALGHAYLFCGERGVGKFAAALDLAMALLCCGAGARPCGECPACKKALSYSHPDLHVIMPLCLEAAHKAAGGGLTEEGWKFAAESALARLGDPYKLPRYDAIPNIPVDWVREADHAIMRGPSEGAVSVTIIDGVDSMSNSSASTMLKTLEEPPPGTLMLLLTDRAHAVLPTVLSRCQIVRFPLLPAEAVAAELRGRFGGSEGIYAAAAASGSLGLAISEYENPLDEYYRHAASLWRDCAGGDWTAAAAAADSLSSGKDAYNVCGNTASCLIRLIRIAFLKKFGRDSASINYITSDSSYGIELPAELGAPDGVEALIKPVQGALSGLDARGNPAIIMAGLVCSLMEALHVEE